MAAALFLVGWCKSNRGFAFVELCCLILEYLIKCGYVIPYFKVYFSVFLLMHYYLLFIWYLFQTIEMMLDEKQIWAIFKLEFKMGHGAAETTCNINNTLGSWTVQVHTVQWWFTKFYKGAFKTRSIGASHRKLTTANWNDHWSWSSYNYMRRCWRTQHQQFYSCLECEANWKGNQAW